jgi:hypothetical protein
MTMDRKRFKILVSFPADWADEPSLAGTTQEFWYPTVDAATLAARGFQMRGCTA